MKRIASVLICIIMVLSLVSGAAFATDETISVSLVFDVLLRETKKRGIHLEFVKTPGLESTYIEGMANIYEFDCGELSGWMFKVNGSFPKVSCAEYVVSAGDCIEWVYTCNSGEDVGGKREF